METIKITIPGVPPTATAQQKGQNRLTGAYYKPQKLKDAEAYYYHGLSPYVLPKPIKAPVELIVRFKFQMRKGTKDYEGRPKITKPDTDNMIKLLKDVMTKLQFWVDDAQVCWENVVKCYSETPGVEIYIGDFDEGERI